MGLHRPHGDRHRQLRCLGKGGWDASGLVQRAEREGLTKALVQRLAEELPDILSAPDPDTPQPAPG
jgi:hypothetical protein